MNVEPQPGELSTPLVPPPSAHDLAHDVEPSSEAAAVHDASPARSKHRKCGPGPHRDARALMRTRSSAPPGQAFTSMDIGHGPRRTGWRS